MNPMMPKKKARKPKGAPAAFAAGLADGKRPC